MSLVSILAFFALGLSARAQTNLLLRETLVTPKERIEIFNGRDLSNFDIWLPKSSQQDPDRVFTVVERIDGAPAIRVSGQYFGGLVTKQSYTDYRLVVEFRWGLLTWKPRADRARDSGILLHCQGELGNVSARFTGPWMHSVEFQIIEGGAGDLLLLRGYTRGSEEPVKPTLTVALKPDSRVFSPSGIWTVLDHGRVDWEFRDPTWKDVLGFRGAKDVQHQLGEWNTLEAICEGGSLRFFVNGVKVNEGEGGSLTGGRLLFQSEGAEIYFRKIELHPLVTVP